MTKQALDWIFIDNKDIKDLYDYLNSMNKIDLYNLYYLVDSCGLIGPTIYDSILNDAILIDLIDSKLEFKEYSDEESDMLFKKLSKAIHTYYTYLHDISSIDITMFEKLSNFNINLIKKIDLSKFN